MIKTVFLYSGQGSQYYNMGKQLYESNEVFRQTMCELDDMVYQFAGYRILDKLYDSTKAYSDIFDDIKYTHPSIYMLEYALTQTLARESIVPDCVLGTSLGEYCAMTVSGILTLEQGIEIVTRQAVNLSEKVNQNCGMMAVMEREELYSSESIIFRNMELAAVNYDRHFVVSGNREELESAAYSLKKRGSIFQILPVRYGFHSNLIDSAESIIREGFCSAELKEPKITYISGITGELVNKMDEDYLWNVIRGKMQLPKGIRILEGANINRFIDVGPGGTLAAFAKNNILKVSESEIYGIVTPFHNENSCISKIKSSYCKEKLHYMIV